MGEGSAEGSAEGSYYNYEGSAEGSTEGSAEDYYTYREVNVNYYDQSQELGQVKSSLHYFTIANFTKPVWPTLLYTQKCSINRAIMEPFFSFVWGNYGANVQNISKFREQGCLFCFDLIFSCNNNANI